MAFASLIKAIAAKFEISTAAAEITVHTAAEFLMNKHNVTADQLMNGLNEGGKVLAQFHKLLIIGVDEAKKVGA